MDAWILRNELTNEETITALIAERVVYILSNGYGPSEDDEYYKTYHERFSTEDKKALLAEVEEYAKSKNIPMNLKLMEKAVRNAAEAGWLNSSIGC